MYKAFDTYGSTLLDLIDELIGSKKDSNTFRLCLELTKISGAEVIDSNEALFSETAI